MAASTENLSDLSARARLARYRQFAEDALRQAALAADPVDREKYLSIATGWHALVTEFETVLHEIDVQVPKFVDPCLLKGAAHDA